MQGFMGSLRQHMKTVMWILAILFGGSLFLIGSGSQGQRQRALTLLRVDGETISRNIYQIRLRDEYARRYRLGEDPEIMAETEDLRIRNSVKVQLMRDTVLLAQARSFGLIPKIDEMASAVRGEGSFRNASGSFSPQAYRSVLAREGLSTQQFEKMIESSLMIARMGQLIKDLTPVTKTELISEWRRRNRRVQTGYVLLKTEQFLERVGIPEEDLEEYFELNRTEYDTPAQADASHILSALDSNPSPQEIESARSGLVALRDKILAKEMTFVEAAKQFSMDTQTAKDGGSLGWLRQNEVMQDFASVFDMELNQPSEPVQTRYGFHLFMVVDRKAGKDAVFQESRAAILARLAGPEARVLVRDSLGTLIQKTLINGSKNQPPPENISNPSKTLSQAASSLGLPYKEDRFILSDGPEGFDPSNAFLNACQSLEPGEISSPMPIADGYLIVELLEQTFPEASAFPESWNETALESSLQNSKSLAVMNTLADGLLTSASQAGRFKDFSGSDF